MEAGNADVVNSKRAGDAQREDESPWPSGRTPEGAPWGASRKVAFRFAFSYLSLYLYPLSATLGWFWWFWFRWEEHTYEAPWRQVVPWVAAHILRLRYEVSVSTSRDSTYEYVKVLCFVLIAALATVVWSVIDRKRIAHPKLNQWIRFYVRVVLAFTMIGFGVFKIIPMQMPPPGLTTMMRPFGDLGPWPNSLLWNFMGASAGYVILCGLVETLGGVLLLIPGMTTLGALVSLGALVNVFTLSGFYEVPVVLGVAHLILLASFLLVPDIHRLVNLLVLNRGTEPERRRPLFRRRWLHYSLWGVQWALGIYVIVIQLSRASTYTHLNNSVPVTTPIYGIWSVDEFTVDGQSRPPLLTDNLRWQRVIFDSEPIMFPKMIATIQEMSGQFSSYVATPDTNNSTLSWRSPENAELNELRSLNHMTVGGQGNVEMNYNRLSPDAMILDGLMNGHRLRVTLKKEDRQFTLKTLRFRWITENKDLLLSPEE